MVIKLLLQDLSNPSTSTATHQVNNWILAGSKRRLTLPPSSNRKSHIQRNLWKHNTQLQININHAPGTRPRLINVLTEAIDTVIQLQHNPGSHQTPWNRSPRKTCTPPIRTFEQYLRANGNKWNHHQIHRKLQNKRKRTSDWVILHYTDVMIQTLNSIFFNNKFIIMFNI